MVLRQLEVAGIPEMMGREFVCVRMHDAVMMCKVRPSCGCSGLLASLVWFVCIQVLHCVVSLLAFVALLRMCLSSGQGKHTCRHSTSGLQLLGADAGAMLCCAVQGLQAENGLLKGSPVKPGSAPPPKEADAALDVAAPPVNSLGVGFDDEHVHDYIHQQGPPADVAGPLRRFPIVGKLVSKISKPPPKV